MKGLIITIICLTAFFSRALAQYSVIHVDFVDAAKKAVFATSDVPADKLPDKFAPNMQIDIKGQKWRVVMADPAEKSDFTRTGKVALLLSNDPRMLPGALVFTVPSVSGGIGLPEGKAMPGPDIFSIHHDDWRQVEFVSLSHEKDIDDELADIHDIIANQRAGNGFARMHVRERIAEPVEKCTLHDVQTMFPPVKKFQGVGFLREQGMVPGSFAWAVDGGLVIWGVTNDEGDVALLCLAGAPQKEHMAALCDTLSKFTLRYDFFLVDWCREKKVSGDLRDFEKYFGGE